jgi:hypothetical protein
LRCIFCKLFLFFFNVDSCEKRLLSVSVHIVYKYFKSFFFMFVLLFCFFLSNNWVNVKEFFCDCCKFSHFYHLRHGIISSNKFYLKKLQSCLSPEEKAIIKILWYCINQLGKKKKFAGSILIISTYINK